MALFVTPFFSPAHHTRLIGQPLNEYQTSTPKQGEALGIIGDLFEEGLLRPTATEVWPWSAHNLQRAHHLLESGTAVGKIVLVVVPEESHDEQ